MFYASRYYDPSLGRFAQPDSIVPNVYNPQSLNRYSYVLNNPLKYVDPTGHDGIIWFPGEEYPVDPGYTDTAAGYVDDDSSDDPEQIDRNLPTRGQAFAQYYTNLCGWFCGLTIEHAPSGFVGLGMLIADDGGSYGGIRYRRELTYQEKRHLERQTMYGAVGLTATPVTVGGAFSVLNWDGYPDGAPKPSGPFRILEGSEYTASRATANATDRAMHNADSSLQGQVIHEIQPVKLGGSSTDPANKIVVSASEHYPLTAWWNGFLNRLTSGH